MTKKDYVNNSDFLAEIIKYKQNKEKGIPDSIGAAFLAIATNLSHKPNFANYTYKEDMIGDGIENCVQYLNNFDPEKSKNPFGYFTQIIWYAFLRRIAKEKKQSYIKLKTLETAGMFDPDYVERSGVSHTPEFVSKARESIEDFEAKIKHRKQKEVTKREQEPKGVEKFTNEDSDR
jgi:hypothetical protein